MQLFSEIFPIENPPQLAAYTVICEDEPAARTRALMTRLRRAYPGNWMKIGDHVVTDNERSAVELMITLDILKAEDPEVFEPVMSINLDPVWQPTPLQIAEFVQKSQLNLLEERLNAALAKFNTTLPDMHIERDYKLTPWDVAGQPAISISISARIVYDNDAQTFAALKPDPEAALVGLRVSDRTSTFSGEIIAVTGTVGERREKLLSQARKDALIRLIDHTPDEELVVRVKSGDRKQEFPARALSIMVRPSDFALFGIKEQVINPMLRPDPATRAQYVKALSDIAKDAGILGKAYNARENPTLFLQSEFEPYLRYSNKRSRPYKPDNLAYDFIHCGAFHLRDKFTSEPINVAVVNALGENAITLKDFVEALQRQITKMIDFKVDVSRERKVRVVSLPNIESAIRVLEKENPDIILAFIPDAHRKDDIPAYVKSITLGRGIPAHVIFESTLDDPESMAGMIMAILAKTGNTPFALADPLEFADYVVGLDVVTNNEADKTTMTAVARIYRSNGEFVRYAVRSMALDGVPYVLIRDLFPQRDFAKKRVVLHTDDRIPDDVRQALAVWGKAIGTAFHSVEIVRRGAPRLYAFDAKRVVAPPWGSAFRLNDHEAFLILISDDDQPTPQPVHIIASGLTIEQAIQSIKLWTLLYYGVIQSPKLPVSIFSAGELAYWLNKGGELSAPEGEVPFWL